MSRVSSVSSVSRRENIYITYNIYIYIYIIQEEQEDGGGNSRFTNFDRNVHVLEA
jgi:hypothetical protein